MSWCPIGYLSITQLLEVCEFVADGMVQQMENLEDIFPARERDENEAEIKKWDIPLVVHGKLIENFINQHGYQAVACSPTGQLFKINRSLTRPPIYNPFYSYSERFRRHPELLYIDIWEGLIDLHGVAKRMDACTDFSDGNEWQQRAISHYSHLDGWSVCYPADEVDMSKASIAKLWTPHFPGQTMSAGRPREREKVAAAYARWFPEGHEGVTVKQVLEILREKDGLITSSDTLRRAIGSRK